MKVLLGAIPSILTAAFFSLFLGADPFIHLDKSVLYTGVILIPSILVYVFCLRFFRKIFIAILAMFIVTLLLALTFLAARHFSTEHCYPTEKVLPNGRKIIQLCPVA